MKTILLILFSAIALTVNAQKIRLIDTDSHLSNTLINQIYQDSRGYIWITTESGLNRFDGIGIKAYAKGWSETELNSNYIRTVFEDSKQRLWIGTLRGLQQYSIAKDNFCIVPIIADNDTVSAHVTGIAEGQDGCIYISTSGRGIFKYSGCRVVPSQLFVEVPNSNFVSAIAIDSNNNLWALTSQNQLLKCDLLTGEQSEVDLEDKNIETATLYCRGQDVFLSVENKCIYAFCKGSSKYVRYEVDDEIRNSPTTISALWLQGSDLYIGTDGNGLFCFNLNSQLTQKVDLFVPQFDFANAKIHAVFFDSDANMWVGAFQKGLLMMPHCTSEFENYGYHPNNRHDIGSAAVAAVHADTDGLWIGTDGNGIYHIDKNGVNTHLTDGCPKSVMGFVRKDASHLWLATYQEGLLLLDTRTRRCADFNDRFEQNVGYVRKPVTALANDKKNRLWVGTHGNGLYASTNADCSHFVNINGPTLDNRWINCIFVDNSRVWIGTYKGLACYNTDIEEFEAINDSLATILEPSVILDISSGKAGEICIATQNGLVTYDTQTRQTHLYTMADGLCNDFTVGVAADANDNLWISTYDGLSCFDRSTNKFNNYFSFNGLQNNQYSVRAVTKSADGKLYFGGTNGVSGFDPSVVRPDERGISIRLNTFLVNGREIKAGDTSDGHVITESAVADADEFRISCAEKSITLGFSSSYFFSPEQICYEYRLPSADTTWTELPQGISQISLSNLSQGKHQLDVRASVGGKTSPTKSVVITMLPEWWRTPWAIMCYVVVLVVAALLIRRSVLSRRRYKTALQRQEQARELEEAKFQFFFNISHEIRTPLTLIINPIKALMQSPDNDPATQKSYSIIYKSAGRILQLINQMLDVRKIERGQMTLRYTRTDIVAFVCNILDAFQPIAEKNSIKTPVTSDLEATDADIDQNNFDKVIYNIYSNAFKYTPVKGEIRTHIAADGDNIVITIADTGKGLDEKYIDRIFDRFYQINDDSSVATAGTGIGLHLTRSIVEMHGGKVRAANCKDSQGAVFTITIPRRQAVVEQSSTTEADTSNVTVSKPDEIEALNQLTEAEKHRAYTNYRVLIADDEDDVRLYLSEEMSKLFKVTTCANGKEAYELLLRESFDALVSDVVMPQMNGIELCQKVKNNININHIPVILLTAKNSEEEFNKGLIVGADAYIAKPFDILTLRNTVCNIIENRERVKNQFIQSKEPIKKMKMKSSDEILMERITKYLDKHLADTDLSVESLAQNIGLSRVHMHRKLKELTGQSARDFIRNTRLKQAAELLSVKKLNISEVAYALGFSNLSHFSSAFKEFYGVSPKEYMNEKLKQ